MQGWGSLGGFIVALVAVLFTYKLLNLERQKTVAAETEAAQERELRNSERRDAELLQARSVIPILRGVGTFGDPIVGVNSLVGNVGNHGADPILEVTAFVTMRWPDAPSQHTVIRERVFAPREIRQINWDSPPYPRDGVARTRDEWLALYRLTVEFTDSHGRRWRREQDQQPERVFDEA
jgi:hypothetical protein